MSSYAELIAALDPPVSYQVAGGDAWPRAAAAVLDRIDHHAGGLCAAPFAVAANDHLGRWEQILAIVPAPGASSGQRAQDVRAHLVASGGLSKEYFIALAADLGYTITIDELTPFYAGRHRAGDPLASPEIVWTWRVKVLAKSPVVYRFVAGTARSGERLSRNGIEMIEGLFRRLKPAHTRCVFSYQKHYQDQE